MLSVFKNKCSLNSKSTVWKKVETIVKCKKISQKKNSDNQMSKIIRTTEHLDTKKIFQQIYTVHITMT